MNPISAITARLYHYKLRAPSRETPGVLLLVNPQTPSYGLSLLTFEPGP